MLQTSVVIVSPGGTGSPALVISARPEPLPPSRSFIVRSPSALPSPKKYTCFLDCGFTEAAAFFGAGFAVDVFLTVRARFFDISCSQSYDDEFRHPVISSSDH